MKASYAYALPDSRACPSCGQSLPPNSFPRIDLNCNVLVYGDLRIKMSPGAAEFMTALCDAYPGIVSDERVISTLYGADGAEPDNPIDVVRQYGSRLRKTLEPVGWTIRREYGAGYRLAKLKECP